MAVVGRDLACGKMCERIRIAVIQKSGTNIQKGVFVPLFIVEKNNQLL